MGLTLIIAEKPNVAVSIAKVLGCSTRKDGYFEGDKYIVTFAVGHILQLYDLEDYDPEYKTWKLDNLPYIPSPFKYKVQESTKKQFKVIEKLVKKNDVSDIIIATDFDREGSLIGWEIMSFLNVKKPIKRILVNEWTAADIKNGLKNLKTYQEMKPLQDAGISRQWADFLIGINLTRATTVKFVKGKGVLNIGRVIMPTLKLIYDRDMLIKNFIPEDFYELKVTFNSQNGQYEGLFIKDKESKFKDKKEIEKIKQSIDNKNGSIIEKIIHRKKQNAPKLFNLDDLQGLITKKYSGWTPKKVLKVAQELYEGKGNGGFITYPRTKSRHLEETLISKAEKVLEVVKQGLPFSDEIKFHKNKSVFDSSKVDSHSAIMPTYIKPNNLTNDEQIVYNEICKRFIAQFMPSAEFDHTDIKTVIKTDHGDKLFVTKGKVLVKEGWLKIYDKSTEDDLLPPVENGDTVEVIDSKVISKKTQPPSHYNYDSLLKAMQTCGKNLEKKVDEEDLTEILSDYTIGTTSTRADTIEKLINVKYIAKKGKSLNITDKGIKLVETFPVKELLDVNYTGRLEKALSEIEKGNYTKEAFIKHITTFVKKGVDNIRKTNSTIVDNTTPNGENSDLNIIASCPECGKAIIEGKKGYGCSGYKDGCSFVIWKKNAFLEKFNVKSIDKKTAKALCENPNGIDIRINSTIIHAKVVKKENKYGLDLKINEDEKFTYGSCPECSKDVISNSYAFRCEDKECSFVIYKEDKYLARYKKKPTEAMIKTLLSKGEVVVKGLNSPNGKGKFDAILKLNKNGQYWGFKMEFNNDKSNSNNTDTKEVIGKCPECSSDVVEDNVKFGCSNENCKFALWKNDKFLALFKKKLTKSMAKSFLKDGKADVKKLYSNKKKTEFDAIFQLVKNGQYWNFKFMDNK